MQYSSLFQEQVKLIRAMRKELAHYEKDAITLLNQLRNQPGSPGASAIARALDAIQGTRYQLREALGEIGRAVYQEEEEA